MVWFRCRLRGAPRWYAGVLLVCMACKPDMIPNTDVRESKENREALKFVERYRRAVEERNVGALMSMTSMHYYDDNGTPDGRDDVDYPKLRQRLLEWSEAVQTVRYEMRYRRVRFERDKVFVDFTYTGSFQLKNGEDKRWARRLADNRLELRRKSSRDGSFEIVSGM